MKLTYVIQIYNSMFLIKIGINNMNILYTGSHESLPIQYGLWGWGFLKRILTILYCTKYSEFNICSEAC